VFGVLARALVSVILLGLLVIAARSTAVLDSLKGLQPGAFILAALMIGVSCAVASARWQVLLHHLEIRESLGNLTALYFIGQFFSLFLPTSAGGDAVRIYDVARRSRRPVPVILATLQERLLGLGAGSLVGLVASLYFLPLIPFELRPWVILGQCGVVVGVGLMLYPGILFATVSGIVRCIPVLKSLVRRTAEHRLGRRFVNVLRPMAELPPLSSNLMVLVVGLALLAVFLNVGTYYLVGRALQLDVGFWPYCLVVPVVAVVRMFPLSLNGIGVGEGVFVYFLGIFGVPSGEALALALTLLGLYTGTALLGGLVLAVRVAQGTWSAGRQADPGSAEVDAYANAAGFPSYQPAVGEEVT
jgi:uncharacterized protein (TIRG00374 family)